jgi:hypothetical protein
LLPLVYLFPPFYFPQAFHKQLDDEQLDSHLTILVREEANSGFCLETVTFTRAVIWARNVRSCGSGIKKRKEMKISQ